MTRPAAPGRVVVVGGGITGLTAAYRLSQGGVDVTVVEPGPLGGKLQTSLVAGRAVDEGADAFLLRVPWALALCRDLDIDGELISPAERTAHVFVDDARHFLPEGHVLGVPTDLDALRSSGLVSEAGLARAAQDLERPADPADPLPSGDDVAVGPYLRRRLGDEVVDHVVDPLIGGINAGDTSRLSLAAVVPQLDAAARSGDPSLIRSCAAQRSRALGIAPEGDAVGLAGASPTAPAPAGGRPPAAPPPVFAAPIGGMARIIDALLALMPGVDVRHGRSVVAIEADPSPAAPAARAGSGPAARVVLDDGTTLDADAVVVACPAHVAAPLLAPLSADAGAALAAIDHASVTLVTLAFGEGGLAGALDASGCLVPRDQGTLLTAISYATSKWAQLRNLDRDDAILRVSAGRFGDDRHLDLDDDDLTAALLADLDRIIGVRADPTEVRVNRWARSFPQYAPGHLERVDAIDAALAHLPVVVAGAAYRGLGVPACVRQGEEAAAALGATWPTPARLP